MITSRGGLDIDTVYSTVIACSVVLGLGFLVKRQATAGVPGRLQLIWEFIVGSVSDQVEQSLGPRYRRAVPLAVTIFALVLVSNWIEIWPGLYHNTDLVPSPSADVNFCYALGITVWVVTQFEGFRAKGGRRWLKDLFHPVHVTTNLTYWFTLSLRLFGNIFAGGIMIALLLALPIYFAPATVALSVVWKIFDMFIGLIQAFIFALLTILYYRFSTESH